MRIKPGAELDIATPAEVEAIVNRASPVPSREQVTRIRAAETIQLDGNGQGTVGVYKVPLGYEFSARRVWLNLSTASDPSTGNVPLNVAGKFVAYQRSGSMIEYGAPNGPVGVSQVPGVQTWGDQQGPYLSNGEVFEVHAVGLTANAIFEVIVEGVLRRPAKPSKENE